MTGEPQQRESCDDPWRHRYRKHGKAIAAVATRGGNTVDLIGHEDVDKQVTGDVVVFAVPYPAVSEVLAQRGPSLAGKVVVDITNPLDFQTFDSLTVPADGSAAAEIAARCRSRGWSRRSTSSKPGCAAGRRRAGQYQPQPWPDLHIVMGKRSELKKPQPCVIGAMGTKSSTHTPKVMV